LQENDETIHEACGTQQQKHNRSLRSRQDRSRENCSIFCL